MLIPTTLDTPPGSAVGYSARDENGHPVPPQHTPPEQAGMFRKDDWPPGYYENASTSEYYFLDDAGNYHRRTKGDMEAAKNAPPPGDAPPAPAGEPDGPESHDAAPPPGPMPPGSKVVYSEKDIYGNGEPVPPAGTAPEDAGLVPLKGTTGTFYNPRTGDVYYLTMAGSYRKAPGEVFDGTYYPDA